LRELSWEWLAGFVDGEGSFSAITRRKVVRGRVYTYRLGELVIGQKDPEVLYKIDEFLRRHGIRGGVYKRRSGLYVYVFQGRWSFITLAKHLMPYLRHPHRIAQLKKVVEWIEG